MGYTLFIFIAFTQLEKLASPSGTLTMLSASSTSAAGGTQQGSVPFPETIPEESSSNDEEHVMIFRLGSIPESDGLREGSVFKVNLNHLYLFSLYLKCHNNADVSTNASTT